MADTARKLASQVLRWSAIALVVGIFVDLFRESIDDPFVQRPELPQPARPHSEDTHGCVSNG